MGTVNDIPAYDGETMTTLAEKLIEILQKNNFKGNASIVVSDKGYINLYADDKENKIIKSWCRVYPDADWLYGETVHEED